jgi:hypothetical protein
MWTDSGTWVTGPGDEWAGPQPGSSRSAEVAEWGQQLDTERSRILASGQEATDDLTPVEKLITSLYPALAPGMSALSGQPDVEADDGGNLARRVLAKAGLDQNGRPIAAAGSRGSETPLIDAMDRAMYGPSREERYRQQDQAAERELAAQLEREQLLASSGLTGDEYRDLFGDG